MIRVLCILVGIYNYLVITKTWAAASHYFLKPIQSALPIVGVLFVCALVVFITVHTFRLILFHKSSIKIQIILSALDPLLKIFILTCFWGDNQKISFQGLILTAFIFVVALDILVIVFLKWKKTKDVFNYAEEIRQEKFIKKMSEKIA